MPLAASHSTLATDLLSLIPLVLGYGVLAVLFYVIVYRPRRAERTQRPRGPADAPEASRRDDGRRR